MALSDALMDNLLDIIQAIVGAEGPYKDKAIQIWEYCNESQKTDLVEFIAWFEVEESKDKEE